MLVLACSIMLSAQARAQSVDTLDVKREAETAFEMTAAPVHGAVILDARLDEAAWDDVDPVTSFIQFTPEEGRAASQRTEVRILYSASALYVGAMLYDQEPDAIEASLGRRDDFNRADWFLVSIDSYNDKRTAYTFGVNAAGVQFDAIQTSARRGPAGTNAPNNMDPSWDAIWQVSRRLTDEGWVIEMRIPYSMLRFPNRPEHTWGVHFTRFIPRHGEQSEWPHVPRTQRTNLVSHFGLLTGIAGVSPRNNLQVTPYSLARVRSSENASEPGSLRREAGTEIGGDVKVGLGPNIMLDATVNPDFGQVEADPTVLNLTAFETRLAERRPFFIEGMQIYQFDLGPGTLPYTRRIGAEAPIIAAAKLSGRSARGLSVGVLGAVTGDNFRPGRHYAVARVSRQIGSYSSIGAIATGFDGTDTVTGNRHRSGILGTDYDIRFAGNRYSLEGFGAASVREPGLSGMDTQMGYGGKVLLAKRQGVLTGFTGVEGFSDRAHFSDVGRADETNFVSIFLRAEYNLNVGRPFGPFQRASVGDFANQKFSYRDGLNQGQRHSFSSTWMLRTQQEIDLGLTLDKPFGGYDIFETRGLGPWARPPSMEVSGGFLTDARRSWQLGPIAASRFDRDGGRAREIGITGTWNAGSRIELSGNLQGAWESGVTAWTANESFMRAEEGWMIGRRSASPDVLAPDEYVLIDDGGLLHEIFGHVEPWKAGSYFVPVFGRRNTRSVDLTVRGTVTFTPHLTLQLYGQVFAARGRYKDFQFLQNRDQLADFDAYPKRDDFVFSRFQSNVVLRWEFRPGSRFFVVWTQSRRADDALNPLGPWPHSPYDRAIGDQLRDTFDVLPDNILLVKLNYTFLR